MRALPEYWLADSAFDFNTSSVYDEILWNIAGVHLVLPVNRIL